MGIAIKVTKSKHIQPSATPQRSRQKSLAKSQIGTDSSKEFVNKHMNTIYLKRANGASALQTSQFSEAATSICLRMVWLTRSTWIFESSSVKASKETI